MPLEFKASLNDSGFQRGLRNMTQGANATASKITQAFSGVGKAAAGIAAGFSASAAAYKFADSIKSAMDLGSAMSTLGKQVGMTAGQARIFEKQLEAVGSSGDDFTQAIGSLAQELAEGGKKFQALGLNVEDLKRLDPASLFRITGKAIGSIEDPLKRASVTMDLLGEDAVKMTAAFTNPNWGKGVGALGVQAALLDRSAARFAAATKSMQEASLRLQNFSLAAAGPVSESVTRSLKRVGGGDETKPGKAIGDATAGAIGLGTDAVLGTGQLLKFMKQFAPMTPMGALFGVMAPLMKKGQPPKAAASPEEVLGPLPKEKTGRSPLDIWNDPAEMAKHRADQQLNRYRAQGFTDAQIGDHQRGKDGSMSGTLGDLSALSGAKRGIAYEPYERHPDTLKKTTDLSGQFRRAHSYKKSRTPEERAAGVPAGGLDGPKKADPVALTDETIKRLAKEMMAAAKEQIPK